MSSGNLEPANNLVVSIVISTKSIDVLEPENNLDAESDNSNESDGCL